MGSGSVVAPPLAVALWSSRHAAQQTPPGPMARSRAACVASMRAQSPGSFSTSGPWRAGAGSGAGSSSRRRLPPLPPLGSSSGGKSAGLRRCASAYSSASSSGSVRTQGQGFTSVTCMRRARDLVERAASWGCKLSGNSNSCCQVGAGVYQDYALFDVDSILLRSFGDRPTPTR